MERFTSLTGVAAPLLRANIDTGSIIASRFMRSRSIDLGEKLFSDWRYRTDGRENEAFVLNQPRYRKSRILIGGINFGCGSSREAAVKALLRFGIRAVIAPSFGEIFFDNACQNSLLPVVLEEDAVQALAGAVAEAAEPVVSISLVDCTIASPDGRTIPFALAEDRRQALLEGLDETSLVMRYEAEIDRFREEEMRKRPWLHGREIAAGGGEVVR